MALCDTCTTVWQAQTCNPSSNAHDWTDCWPPRSGTATHYDPGVMMGWGFYSPGYICPSGYTTAALATFSGSSGWGVEYSLTSGETAAACCPSGFGIGSVVATDTGVATSAQTCVAVVSDAGATFSTVQCSGGQFTGFSVVTVPETVSGQVLATYTVYAPLVQMNWREGDVPASSTTTGGGGGTTSAGASPGTPSATTITETGAGGTVTVVTATSTPTSSASGGSSGGLSTGAQAGIGVGAAAGAILLLGLAVFLFWSRRRRRQQAHGTESLPGAESALGSDPKKAAAAEGAEADGTEVRELDGQPVQAELPTRGPSHRTVEGMAVPNIRRSDQGWIVPPGDGLVPPLEPHHGAVFELEGDSTPGGSLDERRS
jgi:hypothetical protein